MMSVPVEGSDTLRFGTPVALFDSGIDGSAFTRPRQYDVSPDRKQFLMRQDVNFGREPPLTVVLNWQKLIKSN